MKTAELTGAQLDYWVAKAEDLPILGITRHECFIHGDPAPRIFRPTADWSQGGPIMDRERTSFMHHSHRVSHETEYSVDAFLPGRRHESGPTMLIAAMRAYVASKYGDEVPDAEGS